MHTTTLNWGILGTGGIARTFARGLGGSTTGKLVAIGSRSQASADKFGEDFRVVRRHATYDALLADDQVQAVYISTPHPLHAEWAIKAAEAGKHVLVEKPIAMNFAETMAVVEAARENDVFLMEAFMYRCHPQTAKVIELIKARAIGDVRIIHSTFGFNAGFNASHRLFSNDLGGGGILDVGCYAMSMARLIAGVATGKDFAEPLEVKGAGQLIAETGVDGWAIASLKFPGGIVAQLSTSVQLNQDNVVKIVGSEGTIVVPSPWVPARDGGTVRIEVRKHGDTSPREIEIHTDRGLYSLEADTVAKYLANRQADSPAMTWDDSLGNMKALDAWRSSIGLTYTAEKLANLTTPVARRPLKVRDQHNMRYGQLAGLDKPVSRLCVGADFSGGAPREAMAIFDGYFERGGNVFDTAFIYGGSDKTLGHWIKSRGVREQTVVLAKGGHTPFCTPQWITEQLIESLERLNTEYADIYMMHRDNPDVPVGEFIDVLNEHKRAGRLRVFGGSNWTIDRVQAANDYAKARGLAGFGAVSNNFSLARMIDPVWGGCVSASDPDSRSWFIKTQMPLIPWSSQARGFFTPRAALGKEDDAELVRCWYSPDNFRRKERVEELAKKKAVEPIVIALAYVLSQPFPTFPLIGPRQLSELHSSLAALDVKLSNHEVRWLNLEVD